MCNSGQQSNSVQQKLKIVIRHMSAHGPAVCIASASSYRGFLLRYSTDGVFSIRRISIRRIPIIGLGLGLGIGLGIGLGLGLGLGIAFGELKFGELKRNPTDSRIETSRPAQDVGCWVSEKV